ncbi:MAG: DUF3098 domain-containing protein [Cyclobacteriaceae bacterium]
MGKNKNLPFSRQNYLLMLLGIAVLIIGFVTMSLDNAEYGFGFLGLTLGPIIVMVGFVIQFFAIMYKPKNNK